jgi:hypothetical protein
MPDVDFSIKIRRQLGPTCKRYPFYKIWDTAFAKIDSIPWQIVLNLHRIQLQVVGLDRAGFE